MRVKIREQNDRLNGHYVFEPGDGTCYDIITAPDPYGGILVIWPNYVTYRYHRGDCLKHLHGQKNQWTHDAIWSFMEALE